MKWYYCDNCGNVFDEEEAGTYSEWNVEWLACPKCGDYGIEEAEECCLCGEHVAEHDMLMGDDHICRKCAEQIACDFLLKWGETEDTKASAEAHKKQYEKMRAIIGKGA